MAAFGFVHSADTLTHTSKELLRLAGSEKICAGPQTDTGILSMFPGPKFRTLNKTASGRMKSAGRDI